MQEKQAYVGAIEIELKHLQAVVDRLAARLRNQAPAQHLREDLFLAASDAWAKLQMLRAADPEYWEHLRVIVDAAANNLRSTANRVAAAVPECTP